MPQTWTAAQADCPKQAFAGGKDPGVNGVRILTPLLRLNIDPLERTLVLTSPGPIPKRRRPTVADRDEVLTSRRKPDDRQARRRASAGPRRLEQKPAADFQAGRVTLTL
jgi:hypothetical protein